MSTLVRSYRYRLYPTAAQERTLQAWQQACWEVQRWCIRQRRWAEHAKRALEKAEWPLFWKNGTQLIAFPDPDVCPAHKQYYLLPNDSTQRYEVTARRGTNEAWHDVPAHTMYQIVMRVEQQWQNARLADQHRKTRKKPAAANYTPRRKGRTPSNPSASGDMPGEGLPERGSVNLEPTGRQSTVASASENAPISGKDTSA